MTGITPGCDGGHEGSDHLEFFLVLVVVMLALLAGHSPLQGRPVVGPGLSMYEILVRTRGRVHA